MKNPLTRLLRIFLKDTASSSIQIISEKSWKISILHLLALIFIFAGNVLIARFYGTEVYGLYSLIFNWLSILSLFAQIGMDDYHIATIPGLHIREEYGSIKKILRISIVGILIASVIVILAFYLSINLIFIPGLSNHSGVFAVALWLIILFALTSNLGSFLRGYGVIVKSQLAEKIIRPLIFLILLCFVYFGYPAMKGINILLLITGISLTFGIAYLAWVIRNCINPHPENPSASIKDLNFGRNKYYLLISALYLLTSRLDILSLGSFANVTEVGYYNVALKMADIVAYPTVIMNIVMPVFLSKHHHLEDRKEILYLIQNGSRATLAGCGLLFIAAIIGGKWMMGLYGQNFQTAFIPMLILCVSHLTTAFFGPVAIFFIVSGREKRATFCMLANVITTGICCYFFIPAWGATGAALASFAGYLVFNLLIVYSFQSFEKAVITPFRIFGKN